MVRTRRTSNFSPLDDFLFRICGAVLSRCSFRYLWAEQFGAKAWTFCSKLTKQHSIRMPRVFVGPRVIAHPRTSPQPATFGVGSPEHEPILTVPQRPTDY